ncbi:hypothetical protein ACOMHN_057601 [Nucella lapillus]
MVCKEDLCCWFKNLNPRNRIEYMCALLHMCLPLELRFVGTVLEHYGKKDYHYLRNDEVAANKQSEIMKYRNITKPEVLRAKVFVTLALMRSSSTACAQIIFEIIESKLSTVFSFPRGADSHVADEILTVLTLAANHPAFMFEQKLRLHEHLQALQHELESQREKVVEEVSLDLYSDNHLPHYSAEGVSMASLYNRHFPVPQPRKAYVQNIEVRGPRKSTEKKPGPEYQIVATWSNGETTEVGKRFREIQEFHMQMLETFPQEKPPNGRLPTLPAGSPHQHSSREEHIAEQIRMLNTYFRSLISVPSQILESDQVCQFFKGLVIRQAPPPHSVVAPSIPYHPPDEEEVMNAAPVQMKSMGLRNSHLYYLTPQLNDAAGRLQRVYPAASIYGFPLRFPASQHYQLLMTSPHMPMHQHQHQPPQQQPQQPPPLHHSQQQQPSPVSPARSELSSTTTSPIGSRSTSPDLSSTPSSVTQLLKILGLDKYASALAGLSVEQLSCLSCEDLGKQGLPREAQLILRSKLEQINREKPLMNGLVDNNMGYPSYNWPPSSYAPPFFRAPPTSPRLGVSVIDSLSGALLDVASGGGASPPVSPGPVKLQRALLGKGATFAEDSSEGSEDLDREKGESLPDAVKALNQSGKKAQVKVSPGNSSGGGGGGVAGAGGGTSSPRPSSANARLTPPDDLGSAAAAVKQPLPLSHPQVLPHAAVIPYYYYNPHLSAPPAGMVGQYTVDPKAGEVGLMGVAPNNNSNNNNYTTETIPIMSTGVVPPRQGLIQTGCGGVPRGPPFKAGQPPPPPQPAHTNLGMHHGKINMINMPAEPKPGSPGISLQPMVQPGTCSQIEGGAAPPPQRLPLFPHVPYGMNQPLVSAAHLPHGVPQQGMFSFPLATRSVSTSLPGSASVMTVSGSHPVTVVTASHSSTTTATAVHRSPSHGNGNGNNGQRDSGNESMSGGGSVVTGDGSLRSSPLQGGGGGVVTVTQVATASSPPAPQGDCQRCAHGAQFSSHNQYGQVPYPYPPFFMPQGCAAPNGLIPVPAMPGYYNQSPGVLTNGYTSDMYPYSHPPAAYQTLNPSTAHMYPVMQGNTLYQGTPSGMGVGHGGNRGSMPPPPQPLLTAGGGLGTHASAGQQVSSIKQRNTGCYNCGSLSHKAADCNESSMETMSGKSVYSLDYKPAEESD